MLVSASNWSSISAVIDTASRMLPETTLPSTFTIRPVATTPVIEGGEDSSSIPIRIVIPFTVILSSVNSSIDPVIVNRPSGMTWAFVVETSSVMDVEVSF